GDYIVDSLDAAGKFTLQLPNALPYQQIWLEVGHLFFGAVYANEGLELELDARSLRGMSGLSSFGKGIRYKGADGGLNAYMNEYWMFRDADKNRLSQNRAELGMKAAAQSLDFIPEYNRISDSLDAMKADFIRAHPSPYQPILENESLTMYYADFIP